jgi:HK97 gp10 family phage protein
MTMNFSNIVSFVAHLETIRHDMDRLGPAIVRHGAEAIRRQAQNYIGTYDAVPQWPQLATSTQKERVKKGFPANEPLLRSGEMRDSIEITIARDGMSAEIGSNNDKAVWAELGTSRAPPRPFLGPAADIMGPQIAKAAGRAALAVMLGRGALSAEMHELLHLLHSLKEAGHALKENLVDPHIEDEREHRR